MMKVMHPKIETFRNVKCGEIFCITADLFNVTCSLCTQIIHIEQFVGHFQDQHLTLGEETIDLAFEEKKYEVLAEQTIDIELTGNKYKANFKNNWHLIENEIVTTTALGGDPVKEELCSEDLDNTCNIKEQITSDEDIEDDEDNKPLLEWFFASKAKQSSIKSKATSKRKSKTIEKTQNAGTSKKKSKTIEKTQNADKSKQSLSAKETPITRPIVEIFNQNQPEISEGDTMNEDLNTGADLKWSSDEDDSEDKTDPADVFPQFVCHICNRKYQYKSSLRKHIYNVHEREKQDKKQLKTKYKCDECDEVFSTLRSLTGHKYKHSGIKCEVCGREFSQVGNLVRHRVRHTGIKEFKCEECPKDFFTSKELKAHMLCHSKIMPRICEICGKGCRDGGVLSAHMRRHTGERPAKCEVCGKRFFSIHDLNVHAVAHTDARPFKCDICSSTFQRKKALRIHKLIHNNIRKHVCKICGKSFTMSSGYNSHMRTHNTAIEKSITNGDEYFSKPGNISLSFPSPKLEMVHQTEDSADGGNMIQEHTMAEFV